MKQQTLTIQEAAKVLGVSTKTLRRWDYSGKLRPDRTVGNQRRYTMEELLDFKAKNPLPTPIQPQQAPVSQPAPITNPAPAPAPAFVQPAHVEAAQAALHEAAQGSSARVEKSEAPQDAPKPAWANTPLITDTDKNEKPVVNALTATEEPAAPVFQGFKLPALKTPAFFSHPRVAMAFAGALSVVLLLLLAAFVGANADSLNKGREAFLSFFKSSSSGGSSVLASNDRVSAYELQVNVPAVFGKKATFLDDVEIKKSLTENRYNHPHPTILELGN